MGGILLTSEAMERTFQAFGSRRSLQEQMLLQTVACLGYRFAVVDGGLHKYNGTDLSAGSLLFQPPATKACAISKNPEALFQRQRCGSCGYRRGEARRCGSAKLPIPKAGQVVFSCGTCCQEMSEILGRKRVGSEWEVSQRCPFLMGGAADTFHDGALVRRRIGRKVGEGCSQQRKGELASP